MKKKVLKKVDFDFFSGDSVCFLINIKTKEKRFLLDLSLLCNRERDSECRIEREDNERGEENK